MLTCAADCGRIVDSHQLIVYYFATLGKCRENRPTRAAQ